MVLLTYVMTVAYVIKATAYVLYSNKDTKKQKKMHKGYVIIFFFSSILHSLHENDVMKKSEKR